MDSKKIRKLLLDIGIPAGTNGFRYIADAISILKSQDWMCNKITVLYHEIAKKNNTTTEAVERCVRTSLCMARRNKTDTTDRYLGPIKSSKQTIYHIVETINVSD